MLTNSVELLVSHPLTLTPRDILRALRSPYRARQQLAIALAAALLRDGDEARTTAEGMEHWRARLPALLDRLSLQERVVVWGTLQGMSEQELATHLQVEVSRIQQLREQIVAAVGEDGA